MFFQVQNHVTAVYHLDSNKYIGLLDPASTKLMNSIRGKYDIDNRDYVVQAPNSKKAVLSWGLSLPLYINIHGRPEESDALGEYLAEQEVFLQHPSDAQNLATYNNPQYLLRPDEEFPSIKGQDAGSIEAGERLDEPGLPGENQLDSIFTTAQGSEYCSKIEQSPRLKTSLQK